MKHHMVATRDIIANLISIPQFVVSIGAAIRSFGDACANTSDPQNILAKHPADFELVYLGTYDDETGRMEQMVTTQGNPKEDARPIQLAVGSNYIKH